MNKMKDYTFGFQYYRAPTPHKEDWERDLKKIKSDGFNTVKLWVQWRWSNPKKGVYNWQDLDELMDIAERVGLGVVLNFILDVVPVWVAKKYPQSLMVTANGNTFYPRSTICRQIGGAPSVCLNNDKTSKIRFQFIQKAVEHFAGKKALVAWDIWNEPELTVAIKRQPKFDDLVCYCDSCQKKFRRYLKEKYQTIEHLNSVWGRNYQNFSEAEPPFGGGTYMDFIDWRNFFVDTVTTDAKKRVEIIKRFDRLHHEVTCHTVLQPLFNNISCCSDTFEIAKYCDSIGNSAMFDDFSSRLLLSAANGKPAYSSEVHITGGTTFIPYKEPTKQELYKQIFQPIFNGIKGVKVWQYRQEILGCESPAWGSVDSCGNDTGLYSELKKINRFIQENASAFLKNRQPAKVAVYLDNADEALVFSDTGRLSLYNNAVKGAFNMLNDCNTHVDFINGALLQDEEHMRNYKTVYFSNLYVITERLADAIGRFVENGGTAIFETCFACVNAEKGTYEPILPGCGLANRFGIRMQKMLSAERIENSYINSELKVEQVPLFADGEGYMGSIYRSWFAADNIKELARFADGEVAAFEKTVGSGKIIILNTLLSHEYGTCKNRNNRFLNQILHLCDEQYLNVKTYEVVGENGKRIRCFVNSDEVDKQFPLNGAYKIVFGEENARVEKEILCLQQNSIVVLEECNK